MSFASLEQPAVEPLIEQFAAVNDVTVLVGAGASMEAGLPSWEALIQSLLVTVAKGQKGLSEPGLRCAWVERVMDREDLLAAGAVVEAMAKEPLDELVPAHLYGPDGPAGYLPGPIAHQVANLRACYGDRLEILTTNYDDLIERALVAAGTSSSRLRSYCQYRSRDKRAAGTVAVTHLHGIAGRDGPKGIVLTEKHYHRMQLGPSWQERLVTERLEASSCLFVGMSLADPNLVRYLYGYKSQSQPRHAAVFVRQAEPPCSPEVRAVLEEAARLRWGRCGVTALFVDHFADAAQLLHEICERRRRGEGYEPIGPRASRVIGSAERSLLAVDKRPKAFGERQVALSNWLRTVFRKLLREALDGQPLPKSERLAVALWLYSRDGRSLTGWAHSDRAHQDPTTISPVSISDASEWVAVRTVCRGVRVELDNDTYASRWRFVRGLPLVLENPSRVPLGCLTITSTKPGAQSVLTRLPADRRAAFHESLVEASLDLISAFVGDTAVEAAKVSS
jgi:SIR2-like domain